MKPLSLSFIGFGLIGGSIAKKLRIEKGNELIIRAYDRDHSNLQEAKLEGTINEAFTKINADLIDCDILFMCAPVQANIDILHKIKPWVKPNCLITDVGSVKKIMHQTIKELSLEGQFVGGHPMAGSEKTGYTNASSTLLENAYYLLTSTSDTPHDHIERLSQLLSCTGAICVTVDASEHDRITAAISHVPHILAVTLVQLVQQNDNDSQMMKRFSAGGFKDMTRIASSSPAMWESICLANPDEIVHFIDAYCQLLQSFKGLVVDSRGIDIRNLFHDAGEYRASIPCGGGSIPERIFELYLDVADETGSLAHVATQLASQNISIKNIGIIHNREFADGALRIEFYNENDLLSARSAFADVTFR